MNRPIFLHLHMKRTSTWIDHVLSIGTSNQTGISGEYGGWDRISHFSISKYDDMRSSIIMLENNFVFARIAAVFF